MSKNTTRNLLIAGVGIFAAYKFGLFGSAASAQAKSLEDTDDSSESPEARQVDAVIDTEQQRMSVPQAIDVARDIVSTAKDAAVIIKTPEGQQNVAVTSGKKRGLFKFLKGKKKKKKIKMSSARMKELRRRANTFCKGKKKKARAACRRDYIKASGLQLDKIMM